MNQDPRRGVPSASAMHRLHNCPASFEMERHAPPEQETEDAASGTRIHAFLAGLAGEETLSAAEQETAEMCENQAHFVQQQWELVATEECIAIWQEQRLGMTKLGNVIEVTPESRAEFVFTGQADLVVVRGSHALVIDYKTGRGDTAVARDNPQLAALAVLVALRYKVQNVCVAIVQPWTGKPTVSDYDAKGLELAHDWLKDTLLRAATSTPDDTRAGDWCKWCKAKAACPAYKQQALHQLEVVNPMNIAGLDGKTQREAMFARAMELPAGTLAGAMRGLAMVERYCDAIKGAAKQRAETDLSFQRYYTLKAKAGRRSINDVGALFSRCAAHGVTAEQFAAACKIGIGDTEEVLHKATGKKGKALKELSAELLEGLCDTGNPTKELVAVEALEG